MTGYNLPPGVTESMIPGNRSIDDAWDRWFDSEIDGCWESFLDGISDESIHDKYQSEYHDDGSKAYSGLEEFKQYADGKFEEEYYGHR